jgi:hypothetical protein
MNVFTQNVAGSAINFFIPEDTGRPGDGAYLAWNIFHGQAGGGGLPRILSWADRDAPTQPAKTTKLEMSRNVIDPGIQDPVIGAQHPDNVLAAVWQPLVADPLFVDRAAGNYALAPGSPARGAGPFGLDAGATIPPGCYLGSVPPAATRETSAAITIGGPGIFSYRWRLDGESWSEPVAIAPGVFPRTGNTARTAVLSIPTLTEGSHTLEVIGQDFAGNWQAPPTTATWLVSATHPADYPLWLAWHGTTNEADDDRDGLTSLAEFSMGTNPNVPDAPPGVTLSGHESLTMLLSLPENSALAQGHGRAGVTYRVEVSADLTVGGWTTVAVKTPDTGWTGSVIVGAVSGGFVPVTVSAPGTIAAGQRTFLRVRTEWAP